MYHFRFSDRHMRNQLQIFTIGHSSHPLGSFLWLLQQHGIAALVDIRRYPGSKRHPHFSRKSLSVSLEDEGIQYHWLESLGGNRKWDSLWARQGPVLLEQLNVSLFSSSFCVSCFSERQRLQFSRLQDSIEDGNSIDVQLSAVVDWLGPKPQRPAEREGSTFPEPIANLFANTLPAAVFAEVQ